MFDAFCLMLCSGGKEKKIRHGCENTVVTMVLPLVYYLAERLKNVSKLMFSNHLKISAMSE